VLRKLVLDGLSAGGVGIADLSMKAIEIGLQGRWVGLELDAAAGTDAAEAW
jgi:hypothetical protein